MIENYKVIVYDKFDFFVLKQFFGRKCFKLFM